MRMMPIDDFLEQTDGSRGGGPDTRVYDWARIVKEGRAARAAADGGAWRIGTLAGMVERRYASGALKRFAQEIGESLGSVRRFRWVAQSYNDGDRARFPGLSFSHFQAVCALDDRLVWLERAHRGGWSVDRLGLESRTRVAKPDVERVRRPVETATRSITRLMETFDDRVLAKAAKAGMLEAVDELAKQVAVLRARLEQASAKRLRSVRAR